MFPPIKEGWEELKQSHIKKFAQHTIRASSAGHPCRRYHWHSIKDWDKRPDHGIVLQSIFDEGNMHESVVSRLLIEIGERKNFKVVEQQRSYLYPKPKISGTIDGIILWKRNRYPFDIKTVTDWDFKKLISAEDFLFSKKVHQRNYVAQLQLYMLMSNSTYGMLILKNKITGEISIVPMQLDYDFCETILKRAEKVYKDLKANKPGPRTEDQNLCLSCAFASVCLPPLKEADINVIQDQEFEDKLDQLGELKPSYTEYQTLNKEVKKTLSEVGVGEHLVGNWVLRTKSIEVKRRKALTWEDEITKELRTTILLIKDDSP